MERSKEGHTSIRISKDKGVNCSFWDTFQINKEKTRVFPELGKNWSYYFIRDNRRTDYQEGLPVQLLVFYRDMNLGVNTLIGENHEELFREIRGDLSKKVLRKLETQYAQEAKEYAVRLISPIRDKLEDLADNNLRASHISLNFALSGGHLSSLEIGSHYFSPTLANYVCTPENLAEKEDESYRQALIKNWFIKFLHSIQWMPKRALSPTLSKVQDLMRGIEFNYTVQTGFGFGLDLPNNTLRHRLVTHPKWAFQQIIGEYACTFGHCTLDDLYREEYGEMYRRDAKEMIQKGINYFLALDLLEKAGESENARPK